MIRIAEQIWNDKYRLKNLDGTPIDQSVEDTWERVATALAAPEPPEKRKFWIDAFYRLMRDGLFLPAGRIIAGAGSERNVTLSNCFTMGTIPDSMDGIFTHLKEAALTMQAGGGIGYDFSTLRPKGAPVVGVGSDASGPLSFMDVWDAMCRTVMSAGSRRGAMMATMRCDHPDIEAFIEAKHDPARLRMFNLSVLITDDFIAALKADGDWRLHFENRHGQTISEKHVKARDLWDKIMRSTYAFAEPGVIFIDRVNADHNLGYLETVATSNPCVPAGTQILTSRGWWAIDELVGNEIDIWNGIEWSRVIPAITGHNQPLVTVKLSDGRELTCTPAHRFVLQDGSRVTASELEPGAKLIAGRWPVIQGHVDYTLAYDQGFFSGDGTEDQRGRQYIALYAEKKLLESELAGPLSRGEYGISGGFEGTDLTQTKVHLNYGKDMFLPKDFVPSAEWDVESRLRWLEGICDSDGCSYRSYNSVLIQIAAKNRRFLSDIVLMLNTLGVTAHLSQMKDCWRLGISASNVARLQELGFAPKRLNISGNNPQREAARFARVVAVEPVNETAHKVFCFTENHRHMGCFNGVLTGQCGEKPMGPYASCLLGSINLSKFVKSPFDVERSGINAAALESAVHTAIRLMDNVIEAGRFPLSVQAEKARSDRQLGLGVTGLADALAMMGITYGSDEAVSRTEAIMRTICLAAYRASVELAKEKGAFPTFDKVKFLELGKKPERRPFAGRVLPTDLHADIQTHGIRNSLLVSIAPTGTISLFAGNVSSGIEPIFAASYTRKVLQKDGSKTEEVVEDYAVARYREQWQRNAEDGGISPQEWSNDFLPDYFVTAQTLTPEAHVRMQAAAQKWIDSSISKTINVPEAITFEDFKAVYQLAYESGCKGCTTYRPNEVTGSILSVDAPKAEVPEHLAGVDFSDGPHTVVEWNQGLLESLEDDVRIGNITTLDPSATVAIANRIRELEMQAAQPMLRLGPPQDRPDSLLGETYKVKWPNDPHALFITINDMVDEDGNRCPFEVFVNSKNMEHFAWTVGLTRMISAVYRRGGDIDFVAEELKAVFDPRGGAWIKGTYHPSILALIGDTIQKHVKGTSVVPDPLKETQAAVPYENFVRTDPANRELVATIDRDELIKERQAAVLRTQDNLAWCPSCASFNVQISAGCLTCGNCGHSKCG